MADLSLCVPIGALQIESSEESDQGKYECVATNSAGTRYSAPANLYVRGKDSAVPGLCHTELSSTCQAHCLEPLMQMLKGLPWALSPSCFFLQQQQPPWAGSLSPPLLAFLPCKFVGKQPLWGMFISLAGP